MFDAVLSGAIKGLLFAAGVAGLVVIAYVLLLVGANN